MSQTFRNEYHNTNVNLHAIQKNMSIIRCYIRSTHTLVDKIQADNPPIPALYSDTTRIRWILNDMMEHTRRINRLVLYIENIRK